MKSAILFAGIFLVVSMVLYPPWIVAEQILPEEGPSVRDATAAGSGPIVLSLLTPMPQPPPEYGPPKVSYEPIYMGFYSAARPRFAAPSRMPQPLGRKPRNADERFYCKFISPTRTLEPCAGRLGIQLGLVVFLGGLLFWAFHKKGQFGAGSRGDDEDATWLVIEPGDLKPEPQVGAASGTDHASGGRDVEKTAGENAGRSV